MSRLDGALPFGVIPGNHDVNNANAMSFDGSIATPVANVTPVCR